MTDHDRRPLRVAFHTLGCRLNQYDTEAIKTALKAARPIDVVPWSADADLYLLNSCTVTAKADQECRRLARQVKRRHPHARVVVAGCYAQTQPESLREIVEIDALLGNTTKNDIASWLPAVLARDQAGGQDADPLVLVDAFPPRMVFDAPSIERYDGRSRAFVKVQDGCDLRCAYCLIWQARGPGRSCAAAEVLAQIGQLHLESGYHEVILTGIHLGRWGRDLPGQPRLEHLIDLVAERFGDLRLRLSSLHPDDVTPALLDLFATRPPLRPHLHLSLQSGSDEVLRRMRRPYTRVDAQRALDAAAAVAPSFGLGADIIVGYPGETDQEFADTMALVHDHDLTYLHVFRYSPRPGTPAALLPAVDPQVVSERAAALRELAAAKHRRFLAGLVGQNREAVVEEHRAATPHLRPATTDNYATVTIESDLPAGTPVEVTIDRLDDDGLAAHVRGVLPVVPRRLCPPVLGSEMRHR